eukprot:jgi/Mesen1/3309/ME000191S02444
MAISVASQKRARGSPAEKGPPQKKHRRGTLQQDVAEIAQLEARISACAPPPGTNPLAVDLLNPASDTAQGGKDGSKGKKKKEPLHKPYAGVKLFADLPISDRTKRGLKNPKTYGPILCVAVSDPRCLVRDSRPTAGVEGQAGGRAGQVCHLAWSVLSTLTGRKVGQGVRACALEQHLSPAAKQDDAVKQVKHLRRRLHQGGSHGDAAHARTRLHRPHHLTGSGKTLAFVIPVLVLDEADRILDLGFAPALNAILANLPAGAAGRQTLLFSATQTKSVKDLARLSLRAPEYLAVHAESRAATPARLQQSVMVVPLERKLDVLWSFVKTHLQSKTLVFLSSCKQVKFVHEAFKRLRPGVPLKCLHGRMKQLSRLAVFYEFCESQHALLLATDVAARGLDFPAVDWVVQLDCPEDVQGYIHRPNKSKVQSIGPALAGLLSKDPELKYMAQRTFVTYLRSIHLQSNKEIFDVTKLPHVEFAASLGLPNLPRVRFLKKGQKKLAQEEAARKVALGQVDAADASKKQDEDEDDEEEGAEGEKGEGSDDDEELDGEGEGEDEEVGEEEAEEAREGAASASGSAGVTTGGSRRGRVGESAQGGVAEDEPPVGAAGRDESGKKKKTKMERLFGRKNADVLSSAYEKMRAHDEDEDDDEDEGPPGRRAASAAGGRADGPDAQATGSAKRVLAEEEGEGEGEDEFLRVKRKNHSLDGEIDGEETAPLVRGLSKKKLKRMKINTGGTGGNRLVFDDDGNALPPLAAMAKAEAEEDEEEEERQRQAHLSASGTASAGAAAAAAEKPSVAAKAAERYRRLQEEMRVRDREDRMLEKARLRENRMKLKLKGKARSGDLPTAAESAAVHEGEPAVVLGSAGGEYSEEEDDEEERGSGSGSGSDDGYSGAGQARGGRGGGGGEEESEIDLDSGESGGEEEETHAVAKRWPKEACGTRRLQHQRRQQQEEEEEEEAEEEGPFGARRKGREGQKGSRKEGATASVSALSVHDQEAMALKFLQAKK